MADGIRFTMNTEEFDRRTARWIAEMPAAAERAIIEAARAAQLAAQAAAPVLTSTDRTDPNAPIPGLLRQSIAARVRNEVGI